MRIRATFIGADGSCGYSHGVEYFIRVSQGQENEIIIDRVDNLEGERTYESLRSFLEDWSCVNMYS